GTPEEVLESGRICIEQGRDTRCGFVLTSGCQMPIGTPEANMHALVDAARIYGR
ncbi:MAG: uroporphyrinogen decarboxylase family protein, partial [Lachnospiraceae bacterium]|nr:uroporphyrinogen decarboxylase family protein [Lachnospiraceae bacterium]